MRFWIPLLTLSLLTGCESGLSRTVKVTVAKDLQAQFDATHAGVVVSDLGGTAAPYVVLCGQELKQPLELSQDLGFGCLGARKDTSETVRVWIEPTASSVATAACTTQSSFYRAVTLGSGGDAGAAGVAGEPAASWAQASATGTWKRDFSPCGGNLSAEVSLAAP